MRVLVDAQALQSGSAAGAAPILAEIVRRAWPGWEWTLVEAGHLPPPSINLPALVRRLSFQPPLALRPFHRRDGRVNERYYGDWLAAQGADAVVVLNYFDPDTVVPQFSDPRPVVVGFVQDLAPLSKSESYAQNSDARGWYCSRLRALLDTDALLVSSPAAEDELRELLPDLSARVVVSDDLAQALGDTAASRLGAVARMPRRIAWVSPLPPAPSGIADYSADLLPALARHYEIELVIDPRQYTVPPELAARHLTLTSDEALQRHANRPYDLFVYQVGNGGSHVYMLELMRRFRGMVVLHDFFLGGLVGVARQRGLWPTTVEQELEFEGETHLLDWKRKGYVNEVVLRQFVPENTRLLALADAVLVHSAWAWRRVRRLVDVPVARVVQAVPLVPRVDAAVRRRQLGLAPDAFVTCSLGHHGHTKRIQSLLRAVAGMRESLRRRIQVVVVGPMARTDQESLRRLANEWEIGSQVRLTGYVSMPDFYAYIQASDVCVQLRYPTHGETSASVLRALAAGAVVVTSDHGPMAELPDDVVCKVRTPQFESSDLTALLEHLDADPSRRAALAAAGQSYVERHLDPATAAAGYAALIDHTIARRHASDAIWREAAATALLDSTLTAGPERDRLLADWAGLRERCVARQADQQSTEIPARKAG
jgi:glycosyltransferase involved in cell wall biosynthesis